MARFYDYHEILRGIPAPAPDILRVTGHIAELPAFQAGVAVVAGSAAWGTVSIRSDIDVMAYRCDASADLDAQIEPVLAAYAQATNRRHDPPKVDVTWIGAESEELVERDNLVSVSAPIVEYHVVSEIFERTCVRLVDHLRALASVKGDPWRTFVERHLSGVQPESPLRRDVLREYGTGMAMKWRQQSWTDTGQMALTHEQLEQLGHAEGFAYHFIRLILGDLGIYPRPDRPEDIRRALTALGAPWGDPLRHAVTLLFALGDRCDALVDAMMRDGTHTDEQGYYAALRESASSVDIDAVEEFMWLYLADS